MGGMGGPQGMGGGGMMADNGAAPKVVHGAVNLQALAERMAAETVGPDSIFLWKFPIMPIPMSRAFCLYRETIPTEPRK
jgi:hypothetical protein